MVVASGCILVSLGVHPIAEVRIATSRGHPPMVIASDHISVSFSHHPRAVISIVTSRGRLPMVVASNLISVSLPVILVYCSSCACMCLFESAE